MAARLAAPMCPLKRPAAASAARTSPGATGSSGGRAPGRALSPARARAGHALLPEVVGDAGVATGAQLGVREDLAQAGVRVLLGLGVLAREGLLDEERVQVAVGRRPEQDALGRLTVAAGAARLLVVPLQ